MVKKSSIRSAHAAAPGRIDPQSSGGPDEGFDVLDREFARFLLRLAHQPGRKPADGHGDVTATPRLAGEMSTTSSPNSLALAAALVSRATREGHVCLDLRRLPIVASDDSTDRPSSQPAKCYPTLERWRAELSATAVVGKPGDFKPLILDEVGRLYLQRFWKYEDTVAHGIISRLRESTPAIVAAEDDPSKNLLTKILDRYFPPNEPGPDWQRHAVQTALSRRFCVISGGPGTGKTYTIAVLVAALLEYYSASGARVALAAPTGKAAIRLQEALQQARDRLPCPPEILERLPTTAATLHRLLGFIPSAGTFRHDATHQLPYDMIIIDEASMVDLAMMARLFQACRPEARVVLVGDMDQLASVEAGAVLGDICDGVRGTREAISAMTAVRAGAPTKAPFAHAIVQLRRNHRFHDNDGIAALSRALNAGDNAEALRLLQTDPTNVISSRPVPTGDLLGEMLYAQAIGIFRAIQAAPTPADALSHLAEFRILCARRRGPHGSETLNQIIEHRLHESGLVTTTTPFYPGRPILVLKNDYNLRLFNGDTGVVWPHPETHELRVWFRDIDGNVRDFAPGRLPEHETVFAMTVHKSQGSEFPRVLIILPDRDSPVLTRELIYTGVTRARQRVELWLNEEVFALGLARCTQRTSGLADRLWK